MAAGVVVNTNISSIHASRVLSTNRSDLETAMARLASGKRVNSAADDAAAASVALKMKADIASGDVAVRNINDGISLFQTLDGAASEVENILVRMRELASQMANGTYADADAAAANTEYSALIAEVTRIADNTEFNRTDIANGTGGFQIQLGAAGNDKVTFANANLKATTLGVSATTVTKTGNSFATSVGAASLVTSAAIAGTGTDRVQINGVNIGAIAAGTGATRAEQLVSAINATNWAGTTVASVGEASLSGFATALAAGDLTINGTDVGVVATSASEAARAGALETAINALTSTHGVSAHYDSVSGKLFLTSAADIVIAGNSPLVIKNGFAAGTYNTKATAVHAFFDTASQQLTLSSTSSINVSGGAATVAKAGFLASATPFTSTTPNAAAALTAIDVALSKVSTARATAGSNINRLGFALSNAQNVSQRLNEALSGLQDTDYAAESANLARGMVLAQAGTAMLAQANQAPQYVLTLLRG